MIKKTSHISKPYKTKLYRNYSNLGNPAIVLELHEDELAKLTDAEKAIATQKNWVLA